LLLWRGIEQQAVVVEGFRNGCRVEFVSGRRKKLSAFSGSSPDLHRLLVPNYLADRLGRSKMDVVGWKNTHAVLTVLSGRGIIFRVRPDHPKACAVAR
jgi:hypothetical protein